jgi:hypothetical protein
MSDMHNLNNKNKSTVPTLVTVTNIEILPGSNSLHLKWTPPPRTMMKELERYKIRQKIHSKKSHEHWKSILIPSSATARTIHLEPDQFYEVRVKILLKKIRRYRGAIDQKHIFQKNWR